jgi:type I restriction enzyme S subunit
MTRRVRVGEVLRLERRPVEIAPTDEYVAIGIRSFGKGIFHYPSTPGAELSKLRFFDVHPDDLVVSNIKAWEGAVAIASDGEVGCIESNRFLSYTPIDDAIDVRYACYFFLSEAGLPLIQRASPGSADRNRTLAIDRFENLEIPLPDLAEQRRIVARVAVLIPGAERVVALTERASELSNALAVASIRFDGERVQLRELVEQVQRRELLDPEREYSLLGVKWYAEGLFVREQKIGVDIAATHLNRVENGDFIYNRLFAWKGSFALAGESESGCFVSNEFPCFRVHEDRIDPVYLLGRFSDPSMWASVLERSSGGTPTSRNRLPEERFLSIEITVPPIVEQRRLALGFQRLRDLSARRRIQIERANALARSALNAAFSGSL